MGNFSTAWKAFWAILKSNELAESWSKLSQQPALPSPVEEPAASEAEPEAEAPVTAPAPRVTAKGEAVHTLAILQREARLIDFLQEDISVYGNEQIGAVVRKVHDDAQAALKKYFNLQPIRTEEESTRITLDKGFNCKQIRLMGKMAGEPPFTGTLLHRGWKAENINLPQRTEAVDPCVICPAEIEI